MKNILVIAVHPDDETLGCGGTILRLKNKGDAVNWCIATSCSSDMGYSDKMLEQKETEIAEIASHYDFNKIIRMHLPTTQVEKYAFADLINKFSEILEDTKPDTIFLPFMCDVHSDHRIIFNAVYSCTKTFRYPFIRKLLMMETLSETEFAPSIPSNSFVPNVFYDITDHIDGKIEAMNIYKSEIGVHPFPRNSDNIRSLAVFRGATAGFHFAESFMLLRECL